MKLSEYELKVLRAWADNTVDDLTPGAALNQATENLEASGLLNLKNGCLTRAGRLALADKTSPPLSPVARAGKEQP